MRYTDALQKLYDGKMVCCGMANRKSVGCERELGEAIIGYIFIPYIDRVAEVRLHIRGSQRGLFKVEPFSEFNDDYISDDTWFVIKSKERIEQAMIRGKSGCQGASDHHNGTGKRSSESL